MTPLGQLILNQGWQSQTASQILTTLTATITGTPDQDLWHWDGVINAIAAGVPGNGLTLQQAATARDILSTMPVGYLTLDALLSTGCQLSSPLFIGTVQAMEVAEPPTAVLVLNAILAIGAAPQNPQWKLSGLSVAPTSDTITAALAEVSNFLAFESFVVNRLKPYVALLDPTLYDGTLVSAVQAAVAAT